MKEKNFRLTQSDMEPLAEGLGGCIASDRIMVDGSRVGYCYREEPDFEEDSGWRFFAGDEPEDYLADAENLGLYDVNTLANYDRTVVPLLASPTGTAYELGDDGGFYEVDPPPPSE